MYDCLLVRFHMANSRNKNRPFTSQLCIWLFKKNYLVHRIFLCWFTEPFKNVVKEDADGFDPNIVFSLLFSVTSMGVAITSS